MKKIDHVGNKPVEQELLSSKLVELIEPTNVTDKIEQRILVVNKEKQLQVLDYLKKITWLNSTEATMDTTKLLESD